MDPGSGRSPLETVTGWSPLFGRELEAAEIARLVDAVRGSLSGVIVLHGAAGIGKTALLDAACRSAPDLPVVRLVGIESEVELGFAALHQVLNRFGAGVEVLPGPQRRALRAAFGLGDGSAPDRFLVGLATLTLLSNAAVGTGLLMVIDDAHWIDRESAGVLAFVARRLYADGIGMLVAARSPIEEEFAFDGLRSITLDALPDEVALEVLRHSVTRSIAPHVRSRILSEAGGNPLALVELSRQLSPDQLAGTDVLSHPLVVGQPLEARFLRQVRSLPVATQRLLLVAAAEPTGDPALVWRAGRHLGFDETAIHPAEAENLVSLGPPIRFRHPLIRSAIYQGSTAPDRRRAHDALAAACDLSGYADSRTWHRAAAASAPNDDVANELEEAANRALSQGSYSAAAALLGRAAQLTVEPTRQAARSVWAAAADLSAGNIERAHANLNRALPVLDDEMLIAQARRLEAGILLHAASHEPSDGRQPLRGAGDAPSIMIMAAETLSRFDPPSARDTALDALLMAISQRKSSAMPTREVARAAKAFALRPGVPPRSVDLLLDALVELFTNSYASAAPLLRAAVSAIRADPSAREAHRAMTLGCVAAFALGDDEAVQALAEEWVSLRRDRGALGVLGEGLYFLGVDQLRVGSLTGADIYFTELVENEALRRQKGGGRTGRLIVAAWRGLEGEVRSTAAAMMSDDVYGRGWNLSQIQYAESVLELSLGNYRAAALLFCDDDDLALAPLRLADAVEAHTRVGARHIAETKLESLSKRALANRSALELGLLARARALLADDHGADAHFQEAVIRLEASGGMLHVARARLLYGEWLRRQKRRRDARDQLGVASEIFESMGAQGFGERARVELLATGAHARKRVDETRDNLTPQEEQIARLAASGASNSDIAARLFISASTVDYHLRKVYRKLGVASRHDLDPTALADT